MTKTGGFVSKTLRVLVILLLLLEAFAAGASACTCWCAAGERALGGGTILAKNRDWEPQRDELKVVAPTGGLRYVALVAMPDGGKRRVVAGVNEKGLAVVSLSASSVPKKDRMIGAGGLNEKLLAGFDSVDAALGQKELLSAHRPAFLMLADGKRIAEVEIAPRGGVAVRVTDNGTLCHTNHYLDPKFLWANSKIGKSSATRLDRIRELVGGHPSPFGMEDFIAFSGDRHDGPDDSIWRTGSTPEKTRTLAGWIVAMPRNGVPSLYVKLANPGEKERVYRVKLDETVWTRGADAWAPVPGCS